MPEPLCLIQDLPQSVGAFNAGGKHSALRASDIKKFIETLAASKISCDAKCMEQENGSMVIRTLSVMSPRDISWRSTRSYILSDSFIVNSVNDSSAVISVSGYIRGAPFNVNSLVHIVGVGACRVASIDESASPHGNKRHVSESASQEKLIADPSR
jgi:hypothetical protein